MSPLSRASSTCTNNEDDGMDGNDQEQQVVFRIEWSCPFQSTGSPSSHPSSVISTPTTTKNYDEQQNIRYERCSVLFNIAALESHLAKKEHDTHGNDQKKALTAAVSKFHTAASILEYLRTNVIPPSLDLERQVNHDGTKLDLSPAVLSMCEYAMLAQGQCCIYETAKLRPKPMHIMLAKIAIGAAELFDEALEKGGGKKEGVLINGAAEQQQNCKFNDSDSGSTYVGWIMHIQIMSLLYRARAEHHEVMAAKDKSSWEIEIARLRNAERMCQEALEIYDRFPPSFVGGEKKKEGPVLRKGGKTASTSDNGTDDDEEDKAVLVDKEDAEVYTETDEDDEEEIWTSVDAIGPSIYDEIMTLKQTIHERLIEIVEAQNDDLHEEAIPTTSELKPIRGQNMMKKKPSLPKALTDNPKKVVSPPLFQSVLDSQEAQKSISFFNAKLESMVKNVEEMVKSQTNHARSTLAEVDLPQALTEYKASLSLKGGNIHTGGLPENLWAQIESIQQTREVERLKENLWQLKDISDMARSMVVKLTNQLDEDEEADRAFKHKYPTFNGPNIIELQTPLRQNLESCNGWLANAQTGDAVLLQMLETFETEPKYGLLQYNREQLDRLIPASQ
eukprot:330447-Ditylum_brightwellii.AAC.1